MANEKNLSSSTVVITGGTGSFGRTMARQLLLDGVGEVRVFSRDEAKQDLMRTEFDLDGLKFFLGDVRDSDSLRTAFRGADYVFHAAALKQVPSGEFFPMQVVKTNVLGSANVLQAAVDFGITSVVCLSTDKAVYPINAMGLTKALMEKTAQSFARIPGNSTRFAVTRYGNVLLSRGSVIPRFIAQIKNNQSVTITDPHMTRFLMTLDESVGLVKHAFENADTGDIYVRKAPAATLADIATALIEIFNASRDLVKIVGIRHGEKKYESLLSQEERAIAIEETDFFRVPLDSRDLNYGNYFEVGSREHLLPAYNSENTERLDVEAVKKLLLGLDQVQAELGV